MRRRMVVAGFSLVSLLAGCASVSAGEEQGDSRSDLVTIAGRGRVSVHVATTRGGEGIAAHVTVKCGGEGGRDNLAGDGDAEGILFPIVRPEDCVIVVTAKAVEAGKPDVKIELRHEGKADAETVLRGSSEDVATTATFGEPAQ